MIFKREKIIRLFHENKFLKLKQNDLIEERLIMLQTQYDDEKARAHDLQLKLAEANSQRIEIESKLNKSASSSSSSSTSDMQQSNEALSELKAKMVRTQSMLDDELRKNKKFEENIEYLSELF